jgi:hypothetical protein
MWSKSDNNFLGRTETISITVLGEGMKFADKAELIKNWQHAHYFDEREIGYLSMQVVELSGVIPLPQDSGFCRKNSEVVD